MAKTSKATDAKKTTTKKSAATKPKSPKKAAAKQTTPKKSEDKMTKAPATQPEAKTEKAEKHPAVDGTAAAPSAGTVAAVAAAMEDVMDTGERVQREAPAASPSAQNVAAILDSYYELSSKKIVTKHDRDQMIPLLYALINELMAANDTNTLDATYEFFIANRGLMDESFLFHGDSQGYGPERASMEAFYVVMRKLIDRARGIDQGEISIAALRELVPNETIVNFFAAKLDS